MKTSFANHAGFTSFRWARGASIVRTSSAPTLFAASLPGNMTQKRRYAADQKKKDNGAHEKGSGDAHASLLSFATRNL